MSGCVDCGAIMDCGSVDMMPLCNPCYQIATKFYDDPTVRVKQLLKEQE